EYLVQVSLRSSDGRRQQPDVVICLPDGKQLVIDAKVSLSAYERLIGIDDLAQKEFAIRDHVRSVRNHLKGLSQKNYPALYEINSPDFVLMFMPIESAFGLAIQTDPGLFADAFDQNILLVCPSTLLATLRIVSHIWKQDHQNKNALEIARQSGALYDKLVGFVEDFQKMGHQLQSAHQTYEEGMRKLSSGPGNVLGKAEKIRKLGAMSTKVMPNGILSDGILSDSILPNEGPIDGDRDDRIV
ncbi:DNA recombination protein RmuC, partial [Candidatus Magnetaquicoccus inordinatus]|uniref:DNA recombination protein RmuC n=1 Tax=Candidatus Magnetaquicoccus inordinatus TaxID=2496818 RepID=UPI00102AFD1A